jgi:zinc/manganese transport system substrate-binding protein
VGVFCQHLRARVGGPAQRGLTCGGDLDGELRMARKHVRVASAGVAQHAIGRGRDEVSGQRLAGCRGRTGQSVPKGLIDIDGNGGDGHAIERNARDPTPQTVRSAGSNPWSFLHLITNMVFVSVKVMRSTCPRRPSGATRRLARISVATVLTGAAVAALAACATTPKTGASTGKVRVVATENFWGSLASQLGGTHAEVTSIITNPATDPHDYEPSGPDAVNLSGAQLAIINGVGYDAWAIKIVSADQGPKRTVLTVGDLVGVAPGGNPHRWYSPANVRTVIDRITADYTSIDPSDAAYFENQHDTVVNTSLKQYFDLIDQIKTTYGGTPVGASESIFAPLAEATGLDLITPPSFLNAISEGGDPTAADKQTIDSQIAGKIKVYVYNSQNATPDVQRQVDAAKTNGIPVTTITETLSPAGATFEQWQVGQLTALRDALAASGASASPTGSGPSASPTASGK